MRHQFGPICCLLACGAAFVLAANADVNDLSGGVFIPHYVAELPFSTDPPTGGWCQAYEQYAIAQSAEQVNRIDVVGTEGMPVSWYVLSAWGEEKRWCGTQFGFGSYDPELFSFTGWSVCCPGDYLEVSTPGWPGPVEGTAIVVFAWEGSIAPVYWFGGYAYASAAPGVIPLDLDPVPFPFAGWCNCSAPPEEFPAECLGALGINMDGIACHPSELAVCCIGLMCQVIPEQRCLELGGQWMPTYTSCEPNPCVRSPVQDATWGRIKSMYK